jgi:tetratricopeptide (TPR) repeat protein
MSAKPFNFKIPFSRFDASLLPEHARQVGSTAFVEAAIMHLSMQYAEKGERAFITIDEDDFSIVTFPKGTNPFEFALDMLKNGQIKEAIPFLESSAKVEPVDPEVLFNLGIAYSELKQYDEAIIRLKRTVQLKPNHARAWNGLGFAYQRMGKPDLALAPLQKAVELAPTDGYGRRNLAGLLMGMEKHKEALGHMREARKALPHDPHTTYGLALALEKVGGNDNLKEADELYLIVVERWPAMDIAEISRKALTKRAHQSMTSKKVGTLRPDVVTYISEALDTFEKVGPAKRQEIGVEIALLGQTGLDINNPDTKYTLKTLPGEFSGLHLVSIMYAALKHLDPNLDVGIDLSAEYRAATATRQN